ncbi:MAG: hypothetical protein F6J98_19515, partial [Moorea sp. SIO4G2]|nr:hypothetical protein [Moorena sp. SIO4G2]
FDFNLDIDGALHFMVRTLQERLTFGHATRLAVGHAKCDRTDKSVRTRLVSGVKLTLLFSPST